MTSTRLPAGFVDRLAGLLGAEVEAFLASFDEPPARAARANLHKLGLQQLVELLGIPLDPVPWCLSASFLPSGVGAWNRPAQAAGLLYTQDPSALAVAEALAIEPHHRVLDLAAAPGGKATHCASFLGDGGLLVANDTDRKRLPHLLQNLARWGYPNVAVLSAPLGEIPATLGRFDRVLLDAPCSGEGMFRKDARARAEWSPAHVRGSAARQGRMLADAASAVTEGGLLAYSTCTFAPEENEQQVADFLHRHPAWELVDVSRLPGAQPGRPDWTTGSQPLERAARFWPHRCRGEGHFVALLRPLSQSGPPGGPARNAAGGRQRASGEPSRARMLEAFRRFAGEFLQHEFPAERLLARKDQLFWLPPGLLGQAPVRTLRPGLLLGNLRPGRFEPSHDLALAMRPDEAALGARLEGPELEAFLRGGQVGSSGPRGWVLVMYREWPVGWGFRPDGQVLKSRLPRGLRAEA